MYCSVLVNQCDLLRAKLWRPRALTFRLDAVMSDTNDWRPRETEAFNQKLAPSCSLIGLTLSSTLRVQRSCHWTPEPCSDWLWAAVPVFWNSPVTPRPPWVPANVYVTQFQTRYDVHLSTPPSGPRASILAAIFKSVSPSISPLNHTWKPRAARPLWVMHIHEPRTTLTYIRESRWPFAQRGKWVNAQKSSSAESDSRRRAKPDQESL